MSAPPESVHEYRVRFPRPVDGPGPFEEVSVRVTVDLGRRTIRMNLPGQPEAVLDVVTARALSMLLWTAVFASLQPSGPHLRVERKTGERWSSQPVTGTFR